MIQKANIEIRQLMREKHVPAWAIAEVLNVHENTVLRHLRTELSSVERDRMMRAIDRIIEDKEAESND